MENTNEEEILEEESQEDSQDSVENESDNSDETTEEKSEEKPEEIKEKNRKGFELRQSKKGESNKEIEELRARLNEFESNSQADKFLANHPEVDDEEFNQIKAQAQATGKTYQEVMEMPIFKDHFERKDRVDRVNNATPSPTDKFKSSGGTQDAFSQSSEEFAERMNRVLGSQ